MWEAGCGHHGVIERPCLHVKISILFDFGLRTYATVVQKNTDQAVTMAKQLPRGQRASREQPISTSVLKAVTCEQLCPT